VIEKMVSFLSLLMFFCSPLNGFAALPLDSEHNENDGLDLSRVKKEISRAYGGARVELLDSIQWMNKKEPQSVFSISITGDDGRGKVRIAVKETENGFSLEGWVRFSAWVNARIAVKRIHPGEVLNPEYFTEQDIDISNGMARDKKLTKLEAIQTILEGQFLTNSAIQNMPDLRRGDSVRVHLISGGLVLSTLGIAEEPGYVNHQIRILAGKSKRELLGLLQANGVIEVKL
jgi:flagella basal body P-ring formation protein FlgA